MATAKCNRVRFTAPWPLPADLCQQVPCLRPYQQAWADLMRRPEWPHIADYNELASPSTCGKLPVVFQPQLLLSRRDERQLRQARRQRQITAVEEYVAAVVEGGCVPSRPRNWHDLLNMLTWLSFPQAKMAMFQLYHRSTQATPLATHRVRPPINDRLTCFDEGGVVLLTCDDDLPEVARVIKDAELTAKAQLMQSGKTSGFIFGHGLWECVLAGKTDITALAVVVSLSRRDYAAQLNEAFSRPAAIDASLAAYLSSGFAAGRAHGSFLISALDLGVLAAGTSSSLGRQAGLDKGQGLLDILDAGHQRQAEIPMHPFA